jgi:hypothetical protein
MLKHLLGPMEHWSVILYPLQWRVSRLPGVALHFASLCSGGRCQGVRTEMSFEFPICQSYS